MKTDQSIAIRVGTTVLNMANGEPGTILNGISFDPVAGWIEYEVMTQYGIDKWRRSDFALWSETEEGYVPGKRRPYGRRRVIYKSGEGRSTNVVTTEQVDH